MPFNQLNTLDLQDPLVRVMLCGDERGEIPNVGKIPREFRGNRTKGEALREAVRIQSFLRRKPKEANIFRAKIYEERKGILSEVNVSDQQLVGAST